MKVRKLTFAALFAAVICLFTAVFVIPLPLGYVNMGDVAVLAASALLGPLSGALSAGVGSALADLFMGFGVYAPATFVIKALMALSLYGAERLLSALRWPRTLVNAVGAVIAEGIMVLGYLAYESCLYGFAGAVGSVPWNCLQGAFGVVAYLVLSHFFGRRAKNYFLKAIDKKN
ncbi:MAG: ECF transporter S component [Clostridia bacterium]|nr:ECF transporter S component [Clostridia bacterium]